MFYFYRKEVWYINNIYQDRGKHSRKRGHYEIQDEAFDHIIDHYFITAFSHGNCFLPVGLSYRRHGVTGGAAKQQSGIYLYDRELQQNYR